MRSAQIIDKIQSEISSLNSPTPVKARPVLIIISGLPGTGKSFFCRRLTEYLPFVALESDILRKKLFPKPTYSPWESAALFRIIHYLIEEMLKRKVSVILDATNLEERHRKPLYSIAEKADAKVILVRTEAPPSLVKKRLKSRSERPGSSISDADWIVYQKMKAAEEKIRRPHYTVNTARDMMPVIEKIVNEARG